MTPLVVVAIPVRDEAALIGDCLRALALQQTAPPPDIVLLVNNSSDDTADIARALRPMLPAVIHVLEHSFDAEHANAGHARRLAMEAAATLTSPGGLLITTDADGCVAPDWISRNLAAIAAGADVVCGRAVIDPVDAARIPQHLHDDDALEVLYGTVLERLTSCLDPDPDDCWPRHTEESGASIAVRCEMFRRAGGVPPVRSGEDRALVEALRRIDARIRHDPDVVVTVSGRIVGRAEGGMAETIGRRITCQDPYLDSALEPAADRMRRIGLKRMFHRAWTGIDDHRAHLSAALGIPAERVSEALSLPYFGAAWALLEASSAMLRYRAIPRSTVREQTRLAEEFLAKVQEREERKTKASGA